MAMASCESECPHLNLTIHRQFQSSCIRKKKKIPSLHTPKFSNPLPQVGPEFLVETLKGTKEVRELECKATGSFKFALLSLGGVDECQNFKRASRWTKIFISRYGPTALLHIVLPQMQAYLSVTGNTGLFSHSNSTLTSPILESEPVAFRHYDRDSWVGRRRCCCFCSITGCPHSSERFSNLTEFPAVFTDAFWQKLDWKLSVTLSANDSTTLEGLPT